MSVILCPFPFVAAPNDPLFVPSVPFPIPCQIGCENAWVKTSTYLKWMLAWAAFMLPRMSLIFFASFITARIFDPQDWNKIKRVLTALSLIGTILSLFLLLQQIIAKKSSARTRLLLVSIGACVDYVGHEYCSFLYHT